MMVSLDGYFEGQNHDLSWHNVDAEFNAFADEQLDETDTLIFGHKTYELMANFWPTQQAMDIAPDTAKRMNSSQKIVFSSQSFTPTWASTNAYTDIKMLDELKQEPGKSIIILGSSNLCLSLLEAGLLDEIRIMVNPIVIGKGTALFNGIGHPLELNLIDSRPFKNGNVLVRYSIKSTR